MRLLLDTHVVLWALTDDPSLSRDGRAAISEGRNQIFMSAVSAWEMSIKRSLGKLRVPDDLVAQLGRARVDHLDVTVAHALAVGDLPHHHRDPFDRLLVAQAMVAGLTLVTRDAEIRRYDVPTLMA